MQLLGPDGLHLAPGGNKFLADAVLATIEDTYPDILPKALPLHFPAYNQINITTPSATFEPLFESQQQRQQQLLQQQLLQQQKQVPVAAVQQASATPAPTTLQPGSVKSTTPAGGGAGVQAVLQVKGAGAGVAAPAAGRAAAALVGQGGGGIPVPGGVLGHVLNTLGQIHNGNKP